MINYCFKCSRQQYRLPSFLWQMRKPEGQAAGTNAQPWHPVNQAEQEQIGNGQPEPPPVPKARHPSRQGDPLTFAADLMSRLNMDPDTQATLLVSPSLQLKWHDCILPPHSLSCKPEADCHYFNQYLKSTLQEHREACSGCGVQCDGRCHSNGEVLKLVQSVTLQRLQSEAQHGVTPS